MPVDPEYLRQHYASLSDEALLAVKREDLVETAQNCYDEELGRRKLASRKGVRRADRGDVTPAPPDADEKTEVDVEPPGAADKPDWLEEAAEVYSQVDLPGTASAVDVADARGVLEAAGIPCYVDRPEIADEKSVFAEPTLRWRLMVPGSLNLRATSVLDRDIFNAEFEAEWNTYLETLSDEELRAMNPEAVFCGLFDRVERVTRAYDEEIARRGLNPPSAS